MAKITDIIEPLLEAPLGDFKTIGNFDKGSSFRDKKDRKMLSNPNFKKVVTKKFSKSYHTINMYFVNNSDANKHTELGAVDMKWVRDNLGDEVAKEVEPNFEKEDNVNIIFTNNKGAERVNMTPWIIAHRMGHAFARRDMGYGRGSSHQFQAYKEVIDSISRELQTIFTEVYKVNSFNPAGGHGPEDRTSQLLMRGLFYEIATFKSARDKKLRDYFEVYNELFAQYVITGNVTFKDLPKSFTVNLPNRQKKYVRVQDEEAYNELKELGSLESTLEYYFDEMMSSAESHILVM